MKAPFICLLLIGIISCDPYDGYSAISFFNGLEDWFQELLTDFKCSFGANAATDLCEYVTSSNQCEEAIKQCIFCLSSNGQFVLKIIREKEMDKIEEQAMMIEEWDEIYHNKYYSRITASHPSSFAAELYIKIVELINKYSKKEFKKLEN